MENKNVNLILRILRIVCPLAAIIMGIIPGSYTSVRVDPTSQTDPPAFIVRPSNYFDMTGQSILDWVPFICMLLCIAALIAAIVSFFRETEKNLVILANLSCFALVADALLLMFCGSVTPLMWIIGGVLLVGLVITSWQEMKMEDANRK